MPYRELERASTTRLLRADQIDGRTKRAEQVDAIAGGTRRTRRGSQLSTIQRHLVKRSPAPAVHMSYLNARLMLGEQVEHPRHSKQLHRRKQPGGYLWSQE